MSLDADPGDTLAQTALVAPRGGRHPIAMFMVRRTAAGLATLLIAAVMIFLATNALPGNVAQVALGKYSTPQRVALLEKQLGLNRSVIVRFGDWLGNAAQGNLGQSAVELANGTPKAPVTGIIGTPLRNSAILALGAFVLLIPFSLLIGTAAAVRAGRPSDYVVSYTALVVGSLPEFVVGTVLIAIFFTSLNVLPPVALVPPGASPLAHPNALVLPVLTLLSVSLAFSARQVRVGMTEVLRQEYVTTARLSGLKERRVLWRYALRNALAPSVQVFAQTLQYLFGGIIIVEALFSYPGVGQLLVQAVNERDVTLVAGITLVIAVVYIAINILADLIVVFLVPKLRTGLE